MQSGTSEKARLGRISRLANTDYSLAWLAFIRSFRSTAMMAAAVLPTNIQEVAIKMVQDAFDAGWDARGLADLAIIHESRKHNHG